MSRVLCSTFILCVGVLCLNLFIALMSDTFQRVYDNARATAVMQRAKFINDIEITISPHGKCSASSVTFSYWSLEPEPEPEPESEVPR